MNLKKSTDQQLTAANFYADLLNEISARIEILNMAINGKLNLPPPFIREIGYLQLRMMCELVAIGCLVAHGEIEETKSLRDVYEADKIIRCLEKLHPNFYPHPVRITKMDNSTNLENIEQGYLSKSELKDLYHRCGEKLHRGRLGSFKNSSDGMMESDFSDILGWGRKFITLLESHLISSKDNLSHLICVLRSEDADNRALVVIAQSPLPQ